MSDHFENPVTSALREYALTFPECNEGSSCVNRAFKARTKNFLFVGEKDDGTCKVMLKLGPSLESATKLAEDDPRIEVGNTGWVTIRFEESNPPDVVELQEWVEESFRLLAPKTLVKQL